MSQQVLDLFLQHKSAMMALSYRILGSISEAEEVVQEVYIKWQSQKLEEIQDPKSWLMTVCTRSSIDLLNKAYKSRESYPGPWLPEPVLDSFEHWQEFPDHKESLCTAFLLILESLQPLERAIYLLHDVFDYKFSEISQMVDRSEVNCRKIAERARKFIKEKRPKYDSPSNKDLELLGKFFDGLKTGNPQTVADLFHEEPEFWSDGGGKVIAAKKVLSDASVISSFFINIFKNHYSEDVKFEFTSINGRRGLIITKKKPDSSWSLETVFSFEFLDAKISRIYAIRNPDKLRALKI